MERARRMLSVVVLAGFLSFLPVVLAAGGKNDKPVTDPTEKATKLEKEAKKFFDRAGDTDLTQKERATARKEAYKRLLKARGLLDAWLAAHPEDTERLDDLYVDIASMMYWIRKEAAVGELSSLSAPTAPKRSQGAKPASTSPPPAKPKAATPKGPTAAEALAKIQQYEKRFPGDVPGLYERYQKFLVRFPDTSTAEYAAAAARLEQLDKKLKSVYRLARDDDPDSLARVDSAEVLELIRQLSGDLEKGDVPVRVRAAKFLGALGSGEAANPLVDALRREKSGPVFDAAIEALAKIGGRRLCARLLRIRARFLFPAVVRVFTRSVELGGVNGRIAGAALAHFVAKQPRSVQYAATETLFKAGKVGALGLAIAVDLAPVEKKVAYIEHLGEMREPRAAGYLTEFLDTTPVGARIREGRAARAAILAIGKPGVRYLLPALANSRIRLWTAEMLRRITGAKLKDDKRRTWQRWYRRHRRELESN